MGSKKNRPGQVGGASAHLHSPVLASSQNHETNLNISQENLDENDLCSHIAANTTACGHDECLSDDERKSHSARRTLIYVSFFCFAFMCIELVGGYLSNSLAIMTDAAHLLSDLASFIISILALTMSRKAPTSSYSFGFHRAEIIGAIISVLLIWALTGFLIMEAIERIRNPQPIDGPLMFGVATLGLIVNLTMGGILMKSGHGHSHGGIPSAFDHAHSHAHGEDDHDHGHSHSHVEKTPLLSTNSKYGSQYHHEEEDHGHSHAHGGNHDHGHGHNQNEIVLSVPEVEETGESKSLMDLLHNKNQNINVRAAMIHVIGDAVQSIGVIIAAIVIWVRPDLSIADPICTFLFSVIVLGTTMRILKDGFLVLMEGVPAHIDQSDVIKELRNVPGVVQVHELHIWSLSMGNTALSVHLLTNDPEADVLSYANAMLNDKFGISHTTIQVESGSNDVSCHQVVRRSCVREVFPDDSGFNNSNTHPDSPKKKKKSKNNGKSANQEVAHDTF